MDRERIVKDIRTITESIYNEHTFIFADYIETEIEQAKKDTIDYIANNEGWEESKEYYYKKLGLSEV